MHTTHRRREQIHGLLLGVAVGEAIGLPFSGLSKRCSYKYFGRPKAQYKLLPGRGIYGARTNLMVLNAQATLNSRNEMTTFRRSFRARLIGYLLSVPIGIDRGTLLAGMRSLLSPLGLATGTQVQSTISSPRAMLAALTVIGAGHRINSWVDMAVGVTHSHPLVIESCRVLAVLAACAATTEPENFDAAAALDKVIDTANPELMKEQLLLLKEFFNEGRSTNWVAKHFGWESAVPSDVQATTLMAIYCFLRNRSDFDRAIRHALACGGDTAAMCSIVGGLVGSHLGRAGIPELLVDRLGGFPQNASWLEDMAERMSHWPHGIDDLHSAPALPSDPPMQILRNLFSVPLFLINSLIKLPLRLASR